MHLKQSLLRVAAAATVTAFMTLGSGFSAQTATATEDSTSTQEAEQGEAGQAKASERRTAAEDEQSQNTEDEQADDETAETDDDAAEDSSTDETESAPSQGSKAQGPKTTDKSANANASGNAADKSANGNGHTPVTVCHSLGNGGYIEITFDENALEKHVDNHDDLYPVPDDGCPAPVEAVETHADDDRVTVCHILGNGSYNLLTFDDSALPAHLAHGDHTASSDDDADCGIAVAGVSTSSTSDSSLTSATASGDAVEQSEVLGVEAERAAGSTVTVEAARANRAPAVVAPAAGILPATGAGDYALVLLGGVGLLAAGAALLARRRLQGDS
jgi:LPXTG-motif cell wall-anchored protein